MIKLFKINLKIDLMMNCKKLLIRFKFNIEI